MSSIKAEFTGGASRGGHSKWIREAPPVNSAFIDDIDTNKSFCCPEAIAWMAFVARGRR
jgi:hypothetical protein